MSKNGTEVLGNRLFADRHAVDKMLAKLPQEATVYLTRLRAERPGLDDAKLARLVRDGFALEPLNVGEATSIRIELQQRYYKNEFNCLMSAYLAEATVPYTGSALFLRLRHTDKQKFDYCGKIGPYTVRLRAFLGDKDFDGFERGIVEALRSLRETLAATRHAQELIAAKARERINEVLAEHGITND